MNIHTLIITLQINIHRLLLTLILTLILTLNNLFFYGILYLQKQGCVMGTICVPNKVNISMEKIFKNFLYSYIHFSGVKICIFMDLP